MGKVQGGGDSVLQQCSRKRPCATAAGEWFCAVRHACGVLQYPPGACCVFFVRNIPVSMWVGLSVCCCSWLFWGPVGGVFAPGIVPTAAGAAAGRHAGSCSAVFLYAGGDCVLPAFWWDRWLRCCRRCCECVRRRELAVGWFRESKHMHVVGCVVVLLLQARYSCALTGPPTHVDILVERCLRWRMVFSGVAKSCLTGCDETDTRVRIGVRGFHARSACMHLSEGFCNRAAVPGLLRPLL
jgi:hypothetical protein